MRLCPIVFILASCAVHPRTWAPVEPSDLDAGSEAFVLIGMNALQLSHVEVVDGHVHAHVVHAWLLPPAGAAAIAADDGQTPEQIARAAGWQPMRIADARLDVPTSAIRSARATVPVEQNEPEEQESESSGDPSLFVEVVAALLEVALTPVGR